MCAPVSCSASRRRRRRASGACCSIAATSIRAGLHISEFLRSNLEDMARAVGWSPDNLVIDRFGLDYDFIERHGLTWIENLATVKGRVPARRQAAPRSLQALRSGLLARSTVCARLSPTRCSRCRKIGRELCRQAILKYVPANAPRNYRKKLKPVRADLRRELDRLLRGWRPKGAS